MIFVFLVFRINDVKNENIDKKQPAHSDENGCKKERRQQNNYEKWNKFKMLLFTLS